MNDKRNDYFPIQAMNDSLVGKTTGMRACVRGRACAGVRARACVVGVAV